MLSATLPITVYVSWHDLDFPRNEDISFVAGTGGRDVT